MDRTCLADFGMPLDIAGLAHRLAYTPRFFGADEHQYSVAQHAIELSEMVPCRLEAAALLRGVARTAIGAGFDALAAKSPAIVALERKLTAEVMAYFGVRWDAVIEAELDAFECILFATVLRDLTPDNTLGLPNLERVYPRFEPLHIMRPTSAERCFGAVWRFAALKHQLRPLRVA